MENDPNKKESKGKRLLKKALRRNSKCSSSSGQGSVLKPGVGESRSKSFENKRLPLEIKDSAPLPTAETDKETDRDGLHSCPPPDNKLILNQDNLSSTSKGNKLEIHDSYNESIGKATAVPETAKIHEIFPTPDVPRISFQDSAKRNLKRKLEDESGAGTSGASAGSAESDADDKDPIKDKKKKNRCAVCRKKVGLTGFECRCGGLFCAVHRYSDKHECSFDYRELGAQEIRRNNPVVVSQKIHKI